MNRCHSADVLLAGQAATLAALVRVYTRDGRATVRTVMVEAGKRSPNTTHVHLVALRNAGLVTWEDGRQSTLRPLVRPVALPQATSAR